MPTLIGINKPDEYCFEHGWKTKGCQGCRAEMLKTLKNYLLGNNDLIGKAIIMLMEEKDNDNTCPECSVGETFESDGKRKCFLCDYKFSY